MFKCRQSFWLSCFTFTHLFWWLISRLSMIYFCKDDCKIVVDEGRKLKFRNYFATLLSVDSDLALSAIMLATSSGFWNLVALIWSFWTIQIPLQILDLFLSIFLFRNTVFERAIYYFKKILEVRYARISNQAHIRVRILARTWVI